VAASNAYEAAVTLFPRTSNTTILKWEAKQNIRCR